MLKASIRFCYWIFLVSTFQILSAQTIAQPLKDDLSKRPDSGSGRGGDFVAFEDYKLFYTIFPSTFIPPQVASRYGIKRSANENILNVMVTRNGEFGGKKVSLTGTIKNLMQQLKTLRFREIEEKDTVYYLAPIRVSGEEILHFKLEVDSPDLKNAAQINFSKKIYSER